MIKITPPWVSIFNAGCKRRRTLNPQFDERKGTWLFVFIVTQFLIIAQLFQRRIIHGTGWKETPIISAWRTVFISGIISEHLATAKVFRPKVRERTMSLKWKSNQELLPCCDRGPDQGKRFGFCSITGRDGNGIDLGKDWSIRNGNWKPLIISVKSDHRL